MVEGHSGASGDRSRDAEDPSAPPPNGATAEGGTAPDGDATPTEPPPAVAWSPPPERDPDLPGSRPRLRVLSVLGRSFDLFVWRPVLFIAIGLVSGLLTAGISAVSDATAQNAILAVVVSLVVAAIGVGTSLATMIAADDLRAGRETSLGSAASRAIDRLVPGILSLLAVILMIFGLLVVIGIPTVVLGSRAPILLLVGFIAMFVAFIIVFLRWSLALPAVALEGVGPIAALGRSSGVLRGNLLRLFGMWLVLGLLVAPLSIAVGTLSLTGTDRLLAVALALLLGLVVAPINGIIYATVFGDLTNRPDAGRVEVDRTGRTILVAGVLVLGLAGIAIGLPKLGTAIGQIALRGVPAQDRGHIYAGTGRNPSDACHPNGIAATFTSSDQIWLGGYFSEAVPPGQSATISVYVDDVLATRADVGRPTQSVACYYELRPIVGAPPGSYRLVVTYQGRTIGEGQFSVR